MDMTFFAEILQTFCEIAHRIFTSDKKSTSGLIGEWFKSRSIRRCSRPTRGKLSQNGGSVHMRTILRTLQNKLILQRKSYQPKQKPLNWTFRLFRRKGLILACIKAMALIIW